MPRTKANRATRNPQVRKASEIPQKEIEDARDRCGDDVDAMAAHLEVSSRGLQLRMKALGLR